jgi:hypothetical protein
MPDEFVLRCINAIRQLTGDRAVSFMAKDNHEGDVKNGKLTFRIVDRVIPSIIADKYRFVDV